MGYVLLWVENLTLWLLLTALLLACIGRVQRRWLRHTLWAPVWMVLFLPLALVTVLWAGVVLQEQDWAIPWLSALLAWLAAFAVGSLWLWVRGLRRVAGGPSLTVAGSWPRGKLAVACIVIVALHLMTFWNLDLAARQQLEALRCEAGVIGLSAAPPRVMDRDNAAPLYLHAFKLLFDTGVWPEAFTEWHSYLDDAGRWSPDDVSSPDLRRFVNEMQPAIGVLRKAAAKPGCYFEHDYRWAGFSTQLPELQAMQSASKLLALDARIHALDGQFREAIEDINALFAMAGHANTEPFLIAISASNGAEKWAADTIQSLLSGNKISAEDLAGLHVDESHDYRGLLERSLRFEEACRLRAIFELGSGELGLQKLLYYTRAHGIHASPPEDSPLFDTIFSPIYRVCLMASDLASSRRYSRQCQDLVALPYYQTGWRLDGIREQMLRHSGMLSNFFPLAVRSVTENIDLTEARRQLARLGVAAYRYRGKHGRFPEKADDLVPEFISFVPIDPFEGKPLQMKRTEHGLTIWSVGPDRADDRGMLMNWHKRTGNLTFEVTDKQPPAKASGGHG